MSLIIPASPDSYVYSSPPTSSSPHEGANRGTIVLEPGEYKIVAKASGVIPFYGGTYFFENTRYDEWLYVLRTYGG
jgi:hypothetical protein